MCSVYIYLGIIMSSKVTFKKVNRKRIKKISYTDPEYVSGYDVDLVDFEELNNKRINNIPLTVNEDKRYGIYILTMVEIVMEGPKFRNKVSIERQEVKDQSAFELTIALMSYNPERGSIFSFSYFCAYVGAIHYYTSKAKLNKKEQIILDAFSELVNRNYRGRKVNTTEYSNY